ncbi:hypothetical protein BJX63DRAFT_392211 [Aspergillus granulosus]|uniref:Uncharacterized protein n=1 Tax=Aspergillus granulosus TaxID=176169 RepID=A0ABR4HG77_9EURO
MLSRPTRVEPARNVPNYGPLVEVQTLQCDCLQAKGMSIVVQFIITPEQSSLT